MRSRNPRTVSVCLAQQQLDVLDALCDELAARAEATSRSGLIRKAINAGLAFVADQIRKRGADPDDEGPDGPGRVPVTAAA